MRIQEHFAFKRSVERVFKVSHSLSDFSHSCAGVCVAPINISIQPFCAPYSPFPLFLSTHSNNYGTHLFLSIVLGPMLLIPHLTSCWYHWRFLPIHRVSMWTKFMGMPRRVFSSTALPVKHIQSSGHGLKIACLLAHSYI